MLAGAEDVPGRVDRPATTLRDTPKQLTSCPYEGEMSLSSSTLRPIQVPATMSVLALMCGVSHHITLQYVLSTHMIGDSMAFASPRYVGDSMPERAKLAVHASDTRRGDMIC